MAAHGYCIGQNIWVITASPAGSVSLDESVRSDRPHREHVPTPGTWRRSQLGAGADAANIPQCTRAPHAEQQPEVSGLGLGLDSPGGQTPVAPAPQLDF